MHQLAGAGNDLTRDTAFAIVTDLSVVAFFFAMRSCEISFTPSPGRTKSIRLRGVLFRDQANNEISQLSPNLWNTAERVTITFEDQKNGDKMDRRTHQRTSDPVLCPVRTLVRLVQRIHRRVPNANRDMTLDTICLVSRTTRVTSTMLRNYIRSSCTTLGGRATFGFDAADLGTKSLRSGAAMSLFLMNHSVHKIMILGRWSSDAFLVYIRPQVLEWTTNMSSDMIQHDSFIDASASRKNPPSDPRTRQRLFNGDRSSTPMRMQPMHLHH
jgi:hypothetical protein